MSHPDFSARSDAAPPSIPASQPAGPGLWFAVLGPPAAWFASLIVAYFAVHEVCRVHSSLAPRIISLVALVVAVAAGVAGRGIWIATAHERTRFMAQIGVLSSAVFSLIMLLQVVATILIPGCHERPRTPQSPDVLRPSPLSAESHMLT